MPKVELDVFLLSYTPNPEENVAMAAKLCYSDADLPKLKQGIEAKDQGAFIKKLVEMGHQSTIEHSSFTFAIEGVSRSLLAQITRHRLASFSVKSQRYVKQVAKGEDEAFNYIVPPSISALGNKYIKQYAAQMKQIQLWYDEWNGLLGNSGESSNEDARFVLPNAAETKMIVTMNARELQHFFGLRCCNRAQWEIRELAEKMLVLVKSVAPNLFEGAGPACVSGSCSEGKMTCGKSDQVRAKYLNL